MTKEEAYKTLNAELDYKNEAIRNYIALVRQIDPSDPNSNNIAKTLNEAYDVILNHEKISKDKLEIKEETNKTKVERMDYKDYISEKEDNKKRVCEERKKGKEESNEISIARKRYDAYWLTRKYKEKRACEELGKSKEELLQEYREFRKRNKDKLTLLPHVTFQSWVIENANAKKDYETMTEEDFQNKMNGREIANEKNELVRLHLMRKWAKRRLLTENGYSYLKYNPKLFIKKY